MDHAAEADDLVFERQDGIGRITFNRPQARNAFTFAMYERLAAICEEADRDHSLKVLVLRGAGDKAFAAGTDINQFRDFKSPQDAIDYENRIDRVLSTLEQVVLNTGCEPSLDVFIHGVSRATIAVRWEKDRDRIS